MTAEKKKNKTFLDKIIDVLPYIVAGGVGAGLGYKLTKPAKVKAAVPRIIISPPPLEPMMPDSFEVRTQQLPTMPAPLRASEPATHPDLIGSGDDWEQMSQMPQVIENWREAERQAERKKINDRMRKPGRLAKFVPSYQHPDMPMAQPSQRPIIENPYEYPQPNPYPGDRSFKILNPTSMEVYPELGVPAAPIKIVSGSEAATPQPERNLRGLRLEYLWNERKPAKTIEQIVQETAKTKKVPTVATISEEVPFNIANATSQGEVVKRGAKLLPLDMNEAKYIMKDTNPSTAFHVNRFLIGGTNPVPKGSMPETSQFLQPGGKSYTYRLLDAQSIPDVSDTRNIFTAAESKEKPIHTEIGLPRRYHQRAGNRLKYKTTFKGANMPHKKSPRKLWSVARGLAREERLETRTMNERHRAMLQEMLEPFRIKMAAESLKAPNQNAVPVPTLRIEQYPLNRSLMMPISVRDTPDETFSIPQSKPSATWISPPIVRDRHLRKAVNKGKLTYRQTVRRFKSNLVPAPIVQNPTPRLAKSYQMGDY